MVGCVFPLKEWECCILFNSSNVRVGVGGEGVVDKGVWDVTVLCIADHPL